MRSGLGWMGMGQDDEGGLSELKSALQLICTLLDTSAPSDSDDKEALRTVGSVLLTAFETASALPVSSGDSAKFLEFLTSTLLPALAALPPSGIACVPCGWSTREGTNAMMLVINRRRETCDVFVCNAGQGTEYHPTRADVRTGGVQMQLPLRLGDVPIDKVCDPTFWFLVLRPIIWPAGKADLPHKTLYEQLLPYLNCRQVNANEDKGLMWNETPCTSTSKGCGALVLQVHSLSSHYSFFLVPLRGTSA